MGSSNRHFQSSDDTELCCQYEFVPLLSEMESCDFEMPMAYAACEQSHPSSSLPTFSRTTAPLSLDEIETLFNNAPDSGSVFMEAISMSNDPFIGAPKISITLDSIEASLFEEFDSSIHHEEEKFTDTSLNKEVLLNSILVAGAQWLTVFLEEVLPMIDVSLQKTFQE